MLSDFLKNHLVSGANYVEYGYGQVEPNHLSAQRTAQIYAQLPAAANIDKLEQGQFVKYDYANGVVNFTGAGEWMLVFNEIKLYRDHQMDCEFAMLKDNYQARVYSPFDGNETFGQARFYNGTDAAGNTSITVQKTPIEYAKTADTALVAGKTYYTLGDDGKYAAVESPVVGSIANYYEISNALTYNFDDVTAAADPYELHYNEDPFHFVGRYKEANMPAGTTMVPRVFKTNIGDIFTTNTIKVTGNGDDGAVDGTELAVGATLQVGADGYLTPGSASGVMTWQVVKVYNLADRQRAVKIMRIA